VKPPTSVRVSIDVAVDPKTAFTVFTDEIDAWYKRGPESFFDAERAVAIRFEPFVGGRLLEVYNRDTGEGRSMGRITVWEPGQRLVFVDGRDTEVDVRFESVGSSTRVTLEHRGLERLAPDEAEHHARYGWQLVFRWYALQMREVTSGSNEGT
jgi:Activator of Hsp90 ATPase homolog 1-like protein